MKQTWIENKLKALGLKPLDFNIHHLSLQVEQLESKMNKVKDIVKLKTLEPTYLLMQRSDQFVKK